MKKIVLSNGNEYSYEITHRGVNVYGVSEKLYDTFMDYEIDEIKDILEFRLEDGLLENKINENKSFKNMIQDLVEGKECCIIKTQTRHERIRQTSKENKARFKKKKNEETEGDKRRRRKSREITNESKTVKNDINKELQKWVHKNNFTLEDDFEEYIDEKLDDVIEGNLEGWFYSQFFMETAGTCFGRANGEDQSNYFDDAEDDLGRTLTDDEKYYLGQMIKYETMESLEWWYDKEEGHNVCVGWLATNYDVKINEKDFNAYKGRDKDFDYWEYYLDYLSEYHG